MEGGRRRRLEGRVMVRDVAVVREGRWEIRRRRREGRRKETVKGERKGKGGSIVGDLGEGRGGEICWDGGTDSEDEIDRWICAHTFYYHDVIF